MPEIQSAPIAVPKSPHYLDNDYSPQSWLLATDNKRIALLYLASLSIFVLVGGILAAVMRIELNNPRENMVYADFYNRLFSMHGVLMVYFFILPSIFAVFGNFFVPLMIGAKRMALPQLGFASFHAFMAGGTAVLASLAMGGIDTGWDFGSPNSALFFSAASLLATVGIGLAGLSTILTGLNIVLTVQTRRESGMAWFKLPLFVWGSYLTGVMVLLGSPFLAAFVLLNALDGIAAMGLFDAGIAVDAVVRQNIFWLYAHSTIYMMILPAIGLVGDIIASFAGRPIFGTKSTVYALIAGAALTFLSWGNHLYLTGQPAFGGILFSIITLAAAIPFAMIILNFVTTVSAGNFSFQAPNLFALAFVGTFTVAWIAGLFIGTPGVNARLQGTHFESGYFHYLMFGGVGTAFMAGLHYWWPKMTGRTYAEGWARISAGLVFFGVNMAFLPELVLGYNGMVSRVSAYPAPFEALSELAAEGALIAALGFIIPGVYFVIGLIWGQPAGDNPWNATGREWETASPPPPENFAELVAAPVIPPRAQTIPAIEPASPAKPDDLTRIEGIGPKISGLLQIAGISTFSQLAQTDASRLRQILADAGARYQMANPDTWPEQAQLAADGLWDALEALQDSLKGGRRA